MQRITPSPQQWVEQLDIRNYAVRQAQSCEYLETYFAGITSHLNFGRQEVGELLEYLLTIHRRQYADISARIPVPHDPHRTSFYFQEMASKHQQCRIYAEKIVTGCSRNSSPRRIVFLDRYGVRFSGMREQTRKKRLLYQYCLDSMKINFTGRSL